MKNRQSRYTGKIGHTRQRKKKQEQKYTANLKDEHYGSHQIKCEERGEGVNPDGREG